MTKLPSLSTTHCSASEPSFLRTLKPYEHWNWWHACYNPLQSGNVTGQKNFTTMKQPLYSYSSLARDIQGVSLLECPRIYTQLLDNSSYSFTIQQCDHLSKFWVLQSSRQRRRASHQPSQPFLDILIAGIFWSTRCVPNSTTSQCGKLKFSPSLEKYCQKTANGLIQ